MTDIRIEHLGSQSTGNTVTRSNERTHLNNVLSWIIVVLLVVTPIPLGSTPPVTWTIWGAIIGAVTVVYLLLLGRTGRKASLGLDSIRLAATLHVALCLFLVVQVLPLGFLFGGFALTISDGTTIRTNSLSIAPGDTVLTLVRMLSYGLLFYLTMQVAISDRRRQFLMRAIVIIVTAHALYALIALFQLDDTFLGAAKWKYFGSATGTFLNRNNFATYLIFGLSCSAVLAASALLRLRDGRTGPQVDPMVGLYLVSTVILMSAITTTNSRMGFMLAWLALLIVVFLLIAKNAKLFRPAIYFVPLVLTGAAALLFIYGQTLWDRLETSELNFQQRLDLYAQVIQLIPLRPWFGFGGGTFEEAFPIVHGADLRPDLNWDKAHNTYLTLWTELGVVFGSIPILIVGLVGATLCAGLARAKGSWTSQASCLAVISVGAVHSLVDFSLEVEAVTFLFVVMCAVGLAGSKVGSQGL